MATVEEDLAAHIASVVVFPGPPGAGELLGPVDLVLDSTIFVGPMQPADPSTFSGSIGELAVFVLESGGLKEDALLGGTQADVFNWPRVTHPGCQVFVRSQPRSYAAGKTLADIVVKAIDKNPPSGYLESRVIGGSAIYIGEDDENHSMWSVNVSLSRHFS